MLELPGNKGMPAQTVADSGRISDIPEKENVPGLIFRIAYQV